jgi:hypothetical protein
MERVDLWAHGAAFRLHLPRRRSDAENYNHMHNSPAEIKKRFTLLLVAFAAKTSRDADKQKGKRAHTPENRRPRTKKRRFLFPMCREETAKQTREFVGVLSL